MADPTPPISPPQTRHARVALPTILLLFLLAWLAVGIWNSVKPLPPGTHVISLTTRLAESDVEFLNDAPRRQEILGVESAAIDRAEQLIVLDQSMPAGELLRHLLARKRLRPSIKIVWLTDPAEGIGGVGAQSVWALEQAGIIVVRIKLDRLRDSNPLYSGLWRLCVGWWSDPYDDAAGGDGLQSWARRQNHKADLRSLIVADDGAGGWTSIVTSGAAHDGGDAAVHVADNAGGNVGLELHGRFARDIVASELQIAAWSTDDDRLPAAPRIDGGAVGSIDARFLTEGAVHGALLDAVDSAGDDDDVSIAALVFGERPLLEATLRAAARGAHVRVLLNPDRLPNQAVAGEITRESNGRIEVRWYRTPEDGAQTKLVIVRHRADSWINLGPADLTRRGLDDLNLAANVELRTPARTAAARAAAEFFQRLWSGAAAYPDYADESTAGYWRYRFAEATGLAAF